MKQDRTKKMLAEAIQRMMRFKTSSQVHVSEICKAAGIDRRTFYYHFRDKYDLMAWTYECVDHETLRDHFPKALAILIGNVRDSLSFYRNTFCDDSPNALWRYIVTFHYQDFCQTLQEKTGVQDLDPDTLFSVRLFCNAFIGMLYEWVAGGAQEDIGFFVSHLIDNLPPCLKDVLCPESPQA